MQISRHWRLNAQRYRLEGFRSSNGEVNLQNRPTYSDEYYEQLMKPSGENVGDVNYLKPVRRAA